jgi:hypothetical protein
VTALSTGFAATTKAALTGTSPSGSKPPGKSRATPVAEPPAGTVSRAERWDVQPSGPAATTTPLTGSVPSLTTVRPTSAWPTVFVAVA